MLPSEDTALRRWRALLSRLNEIEARSVRDVDAVRAYVQARVGPHIRPLLLLRPAAVSASPPLPELGPPCPECTGPMRQEREALVACTACLAVTHAACLAPGVPCRTPACLAERAGRRATGS